MSNKIYDLLKWLKYCLDRLWLKEQFLRIIFASYIFKIDFGDVGFKHSSAQLANLYKIDDLEGRQIIAVTNIKPKQIANFESECLILGVVENENDISLIQPDKEVENGLRILQLNFQFC